MIKTEHSEALKPSGIPWIGDIPKAWKVLKTRRLFRDVKRIVGNKASECERLSLTLQGVLKRDKEASEGLQPTKFDGYQILRKNELVFKLIDLENIKTSRVGISPFEEGMVSPAYIVLTNNSDNNKFYYYYYMFLYNSHIFNYLGGDGVRSALNANDLLNIPIPLPPQPEQEAIARYLDDKCSQVDATVEKEKLAIAKLKEYKQAVITEAVTKGLNPHAPLKPCGIPWIGDIPEAWERTKLKRLLEIPITDGPHETPLFIDEGIPFISAEAIKNNTVNFDLKRGYISKEEHLRFSKKCKPKVHDIFMVKSGATTGNIALVETTEEFGIWSPLALMRSNKERLYFKYLFYYLQSHLFKKQVEQFWSYGTQQNIGMEVLGNLFLAYPPPIEQEAIARYLDDKCSQVEDVIAQKEAIIVKLNDYKKSLIYECVTGKKKVPTL